LTSAVRPEGFFGKRIQFARLNIVLNLTIPGLRVEFRVPLPELRELLSGELLYLALEIMNLAHGSPPISIVSIRPWRCLLDGCRVANWY